MSEFYHNLSLEALSKSNHETLLNFSKTFDLVMNVNQTLQGKTYSFKRIEQETKQNELEIFKTEIFFKEDYDAPNILEQEVADAIIEHKKSIYLRKITIRHIRCLRQPWKLSVKKKKKNNNT